MTECSLTLIVVCPLAVWLRKGHFPTYYTLEQDTRFELALSVWKTDVLTTNTNPA